MAAPGSDANVTIAAIQGKSSAYSPDPNRQHGDGAAVESRDRKLDGLIVSLQRWKDLRHTFATRLRMRNADLKSIGELMGHTTTRMTERYSSTSL